MKIKRELQVFRRQFTGIQEENQRLKVENATLRRDAAYAGALN